MEKVVAWLKWRLGYHSTAKLDEPSHPIYTELIALVSSLIDVTLPFLYIIYSTKEQPEITTPTTPCRKVAISESFIVGSDVATLISWCYVCVCDMCQVYWIETNCCFLLFLPRMPVLHPMYPSIFLLWTHHVWCMSTGLEFCPSQDRRIRQVELNHHNVTMVQILRNLRQPPVLVGTAICVMSCLFSSTSTITMWFPVSKNRSGRLLEHPPSILLSHVQILCWNFAIRKDVTVVSFVL